MLDKDKMNMADPVMVGRAAMGVIDGVQDFTPEAQALGMATAFLCLCERFNLRPNDTFLTVQNVMNGVDGSRGEFRAVKSYLAGELRG